MKGNKPVETLDARGLECPIPVLKTRSVVETRHPIHLAVQVDNPAACENVTRFLNSQGYRTHTEAQESVFTITGALSNDGVSTDAGAPAPQPLPVPVSPVVSGSRKVMVMISADRIGRGDDTLGEKLMENFLSTLKEMGPELWRLVFVNSGVRLTTAGASPLPALKDLETSGVTIMVCGTCLNFFNLLDQKEVGQTTNMLDIVTSMQLADVVINI